MVGGVSLAEPLDEQLHHELNRALLEWKVLFFRQQNLTGAQHAAFARHWGELEAHPFAKARTFYQPEETPEVLRLYVNVAFTQHIVGMDPIEGAELLGHLYRQASHPELQCRFRWAAGDVAFWDNRATQHYASSDYFPQRRVMERITIIGDRPR